MSYQTAKSTVGFKLKKVVSLKAVDDDHVAVLNYRIKTRKSWEPGTVIQVETKWGKPGGKGPLRPWNIYTVILDRTSENGNAILLYVGDEDIRLTSKPKRRRKS